MRTIFAILTLFFITIQLNGQSPESENPALSTIESIHRHLANKEYDKAKEFLIDKDVSKEKLEKLQKVLNKVLIYIDSGKTEPVQEGSRQYSIDVRSSVIFLLKEKDKLYLTKGTTSNIDSLLKGVELLGTPEKTMDYFIEKTKTGELQEASKTFVGKYEKIDKENAENFGKVLEYVREQEIEGNYQGVTQNSLVSYPLGEGGSISLALENGDWLFTISTRKHIPLLHKHLVKKSLNQALPPWLNNKVFLLKNWQWIGILAIIILGLIAQWILKLTVRKAVIQKMEVEEEGDKNFKSITILTVSLSWYLLFPYLDLDENVKNIITTGAGIIAMVSALFVIFKLLDYFKRYLMKKADRTDTKVDNVLIPMFHKIAKIGVFIVGTVLIASNMGLNVASLLAGLGLAGMALALAAKDTVENIFGSVTVLLDKPFEVGDFISINGIDGIVEQIGLRSTRIRTFYCSQVNVPNSTLIKATVDNYGRRNYRRIRTTLSLTYDTPPDKIEAFCEGIRELIRNHPYTRKDNYHVYFINFNSASLDVLLQCYIDTSDFAIELREKQRLFVDIIRLAGRLEVEFAFPTQTIHMANAEDLYDAEKETNIQKINEAVLSGRNLSSKILNESLPDKSSLPEQVDYLKGNTYTKEGPKK